MVRSKSKRLGLREIKPKRRKTLERELEWVRMTLKKEVYKNRRARLSNYENLLSQKSKEKEENWSYIYHQVLD